MGGNELRYVKEAFNTNWIAPVGPNIDLFEQKGSVRSVNIDEWIGGWSVYENLISDHRPILLSLPIK